MAGASTVINFEVWRNLRKKAFWFASLAPPILILAIISLSHASSQSAANSSNQAKIAANTKLAVLDETGLVNKQLLATKHVTIESTQQAGIDAVKNGSISAFIYYPKDLAKDGIQIYEQDRGISLNQPYNTLATQLVKTSALSAAGAATGNPQLVKVLEKDPTVTTTDYKNGRAVNNLAGIIAPGVFLMAFLTLIVLQSYLMITSTTEEKENRAAEILLTAIKSRSLIVGKILSLFLLGLVQLLVVIVPLLLAYAIFRQHIELPGGVSLSHIPLDPKAITFGFLFFVSGIVLFTGSLVGLGALFPNAQEAGRYLGFTMLWAFVPIYSIGFIIGSSHTMLVNIFTYLPLTAPTTVLIRNAAGTISTAAALASLAITVASAVAAMLFAMRAFRHGAMEYGRRVSIKEIF